VPSYLLEDARQEAYIGIIKASNNYDGRCKFRTFAEFRARGAVSDYLRREDFVKRAGRDKIKAGELEPSYVDASLVPLQDSFSFTPLEAREVTKWLGCLTGFERQVIWAVYFEDETVQDVSKKLGYPASIVYRAKWRAIKKIREYLGFINETN
jgi:RNA polymerase sigma factor (sigma-70 family)